MAIETKPSAVLETWTFTAHTSASSIVLPDGCRDLILHQRNAQAPTCFVSDLSQSAYVVASDAGSSFVGYRFKVGAVFDQSALLKAVVSLRHFDHDSVLPCIADLVRVNDHTTQALSSLAQRSTVAAAASTCGLSVRSFERMVQQLTHRTPSYWKALARIRAAAAFVARISLHQCPLAPSTLAKGVALSDIAADYGFADQAHMSREFRRWFGVTPGQFRANTALMETALQMGYPS